MNFKKSLLYQQYSFKKLPKGINILIFDYVFFIPKTKKEIKNAVNEWCYDKKLAEKKYGHISTWCTFYITDMSDLFSYENSFDRLYYHDFNDDITNWDTQNVVDMSYMFSGCINFNQDISNWNISNVIDTSYMFNYALDFDKDLTKWNIKNIKYKDNMFNKN